MFIRRLVDPSEEEIDQIADIFSQTLGLDPACRFICDYDPIITRKRFRALVITAAKDNELWVAGSEPQDGIGVEGEGGVERDGGGIEAAMVVVPPGHVYGGTPNHNGSHQAAYLECLRPNTKAWMSETLMPFINYFMTTTFGPDEVTRSYYLSHLAALPSAQGKGLGSGLCRALLVRAEAEGEGVTLLTQKDDNVRFYRKFGFAIRGSSKVDIRGVDQTWWGMSEGAQVYGKNVWR